MSDTTNRNKEAPAVVGYRVGQEHVCSECAPEWFADHGQDIIAEGKVVTNLATGDIETELDFSACDALGIEASCIVGSTHTVAEECDTCCAVMREYEIGGPADASERGYYL